MPSEADNGPGTGLQSGRVVHVHPSLRCNLACEHCYSQSGPDAVHEIAPHALITRLERLRAEGYDAVSFSGGEPFLYCGFDHVAEQASHMGFRVNVISNGMLLSKRRIEKLQPVVDLVGVSLDGVPERHDRMRGESGAFHRMSRRLPWLRRAGMPFGLVHCATRESLSDLPWIVDFALLSRAKLLQINPLTLAGRAGSRCSGLRLSQSDLARLYLLVDFLKVQVRGRLDIQLDLLSTRHALDRRQHYPLLHAEAPRSARLSDLVNPLVMDSDGQLWPLCYEMPVEQRIATGTQLRWEQDIDAYKADGAALLRDRLERAFEALDAGRAIFVDWYAHVAERRFTPPRPPQTVELQLLRAVG